MRDLLNIVDTLSEATSLSAGEIVKYDERFNKFIDKIKRGEPFTTVDGKEVTIDPEEAKRFFNMRHIANNFKGAITAKTTDGAMIPLSRLAKTAEFGGQTAAIGQGAETAGKEALKVKPSQIGITDKDIPAVEFYDVIKNNPVLNSTDYGKVIIQLASYIGSGDPVVLPPEYLKPDKSKIVKAIVDYAGEYLGVLALLYNRSRFPRKAEFEKWLGAAIGDLILNFPGKANTNIADSYASVRNAKTNHTLNISSKGTGGGAPPAISGLKIPDNLKNNPEYALAIQFIQICQDKDTIAQAFDAIDLIYKANPKAIDPKWGRYLPFSVKFPNIEQLARNSIASKKQPVKVPLSKQFQPLISDIAAKEDATDGGKLVYAIKKEVAHAINNNNAIPEFKAVILEILEMNFIQQYTDYKAGQLTFATQWPAKLEGVVTVENKSSASNPTSGGFSFKLGRGQEMAPVAEHSIMPIIEPQIVNTVGRKKRK